MQQIAIILLLLWCYCGDVTAQVLSSQPQVTIPSTYFGMHLLHLVDNNYPWPSPPFAVTTLRTQNSAVFWIDLNAENGVFNWSNFDIYINDALANGVNDVSYSFFLTPSWASSNPSGSCGQEPNGTCYPPSSNTYVSEFITALVTEWNRIAPAMAKTIECWNEIDVSTEWNGTLSQMLSLCQAVYAAAKTVDSTVKITTPSVTMSDTTSAGVISSYLALGGANYADIFAFHGYPLNSPVPPLPSEIIFQASNFITAVQGYNINPVRPIWDSESSWGSTSAAMLTTDESIAYVAVQKILEWAGGVVRQYWYAYDTTFGTLCVNGNGCSGTLNAAGISYQNVALWMVGAQMLPIPRCNVPVGVVYACNFVRTGGYRAQAVWTSDASTLSYTVPSWATQYRDLTGSLTTGIGSTVTIGQKPILLENFSAF